MAVSPPVRPVSAPQTAGRVIDLGGQATHVFQFSTPIDMAYSYFRDVPAIFRLLPDTLDVRPYSDSDYRLVIGATDGYGHSMSAVFDLHTDCDSNHAIHIGPATNSPAINLGGLVFRGDLWADAVFKPTSRGTAVEYMVEIALSIPVPGVLRLVPQSFLQNLGEHAMKFKMTQMINGFANDIDADFHRWLSQG